MPTSRCRKPSMMNVSVAKVSSTCPSLSQGFSSNDQISKGDNEEIGNSRRNHLSVRWMMMFQLLTQLQSVTGLL